MKELSKEQKLKVLEEAINKYNGDYLCPLIARESYFRGYLTNDEYGQTSNEVIVRTLIPELLQFKPRGKNIYAPWFGSCLNPESIAKRLSTLKELVEIITLKD
jgi:hypothetical protein